MTSFGAQPRLAEYATKTWDTSSPPSAPNNAATLRVYVRVRPLLPRDLEQGAFALAAVQAPCTIHFTHPTLTWSGGRFATKTYEADGVLDTDAHNDEVWASVGMERVIKEAMECEKEVCLVAYGQTGTGKTYTTTYLESRVCDTIFASSPKSVVISAFELRGSEAYDLLSQPPFHPVKVVGAASSNYPGLSESSASTKDELLQLVEAAAQLRTTRSTLKNDTSSRSHSIMRITFQAPCGHTSSITIVDLAGSERAATATANVDPARQREAIETNKSLAALKDCIRARLLEADHVPWRANKLTMVLQRAFAGEAELVVLACVSPSVVDAEDTLGTLNYVTPFRLTGRDAMDAVAKVHFVETTRPQDPRRWSHGDSVTYVKRNFPKLVVFLPQLLPAPSAAIASLLDLSQEQLLERISTSTAGELSVSEARLLAQVKIALPSYHANLERLADSGGVQAKSVWDGEPPRPRALASTRKDVLDILGGKGRDANVSKETRIDWRGEEWDLSKR